MSTLYLDRKDAAIGWRDGAIEIRVPGEGVVRAPMRGLERIVIVGTSTVSSGLLAQCWSAGTAVLFLSGRRAEPTARFFGGAHNDAAIRVEQCVASRDLQAVAGWSAEIVVAKLTMQVRFLKRLCASRRGSRAKVKPAIETITSIIDRVRERAPSDGDVLRGLEGAAAAAYFPAFAVFFPPSLGFRRRVRRPPTDPVNAALSLGYVLATFEAGRQAQIAGLDPAVGALHALSHGRDSLALDLVEPVRPMVDELVQELFRDRTLAADYFATGPDGAVMLGKAGRRRFFERWEGCAPPIRRLLRQICREAVRRLRARIALSSS